MNKYVLFFVATSLIAQSPVPLTREERLEFENASLKLQMLKVREEQINKDAQVVFEGACKRASIPVGQCRLDQGKGELTREADKGDKKK